MFRAYEKTDLFRRNIDLKKYLTEKFEALPYTIPDCHNLKRKIVSRFVILKLKLTRKKITQKKKKFNSKTMAMHYNVN